MWILILTLYANAPAVTAIPKFDNEAACASAGTAWLQQMKDKMPRHAEYSFVCVKSN